MFHKQIPLQGIPAACSGQGKRGNNSRNSDLIRKTGFQSLTQTPRSPTTQEIRWVVKNPRATCPVEGAGGRFRSRLGAGMKLLACSLEKPPSQGAGFGMGRFSASVSCLLITTKRNQNKAKVICQLSSLGSRLGSGRQHGASAARGAGRSWEMAQPGPASFPLICCFVLPQDVVRGADWGRSRKTRRREAWCSGCLFPAPPA